MSNFITNKQDGISTLGASEWNQIQEINNLILASGITLDVNTVNQLAKSIANHVGSANFFTENGVVNAYTLIASGSYLAPTAYTEGMIIRFITSNANTTTTPTINLAGLGAKNILKRDGSPVSVGEINGYVELRYDGVAFRVLTSGNINATNTNQGISYLDNPIILANNSGDTNNDIDFSAGNVKFSDGSGQAILNSLITKRLDASWVAGNNQGGLFTGSKANSTWYYCFVIFNPTTGVYDCGFDTSPTGANAPAGFTKKALIHCIKTNASGNILNGTWFANKKFSFNSQITEFSSLPINNNYFLLSATPPINCYAFLTADMGALSTGAFPSMKIGTNPNNFYIFGGSPYSGGDYDSGIIPLSNANIYIAADSAGSFSAKLYNHGFQLI